MFCKYCGKPLSGSRCYYCGYTDCVGVKQTTSSDISENEQEFRVDSPYESPSFETSYSPVVAKPTYGMKWFKFLIYFALFAGAISNLGTAIMTMSGMMFEMVDAPTDVIYRMFPGLKVWSIAYGIMLIALAVFCIVTRFLLAKFKKSGPVCLYGLYAAGAIVSIVMCFVGGRILHANLFEPSIIGSIVGSVVMLIVNIKYFTTRRELFIN